MIVILQNHTRLGIGLEEEYKHILLGADTKGPKAMMGYIVMQPYEARATAKLLLEMAHKIDGLNPNKEELNDCFEKSIGCFKMGE